MKAAHNIQCAVDLWTLAVESIKKMWCTTYSPQVWCKASIRIIKNMGNDIRYKAK